jgi:hypothetical protein
MVELPDPITAGGRIGHDAIGVFGKRHAAGYGLDRNDKTMQPRYIG